MSKKTKKPNTLVNNILERFPNAPMRTFKNNRHEFEYMLQYEDEKL